MSDLTTLAAQDFKVLETEFTELLKRRSPHIIKLFDNFIEAYRVLLSACWKTDRTNWPKSLKYGDGEMLLVCMTGVLSQLHDSTYNGNDKMHELYKHLTADEKIVDLITAFLASIKDIETATGIELELLGGDNFATVEFNTGSAILKYILTSNYDYNNYNNTFTLDFSDTIE